MRNVPVVAARVALGRVDGSDLRRAFERGVERMDLADSGGPIAISLDFDATPFYADLRAIAEAISAAHRASPRRGSPVILALTGDVGAILGRILTAELGQQHVLAIDALELSELDFIDIGEPIEPAHAMPVVIKSLVFPAS